MNDQKDLGVSAITPPRFPLQSSAEDGERISTSIADAKERPILFSGPMVRAILDGSKTQTRRVVKWPNKFAREDLHRTIASVNPSGDGNWIGWSPHPVTDEQSIAAYPSGGGFPCPYGKPGDRLWVRETHYVENVPGPGHTGFILYKATDPDAPVSKWRPSIHMPRWASRITLEVVSVRVERLKDCSITDALAEGIITDDEWPVDPRESYQSLWESINGSGSWDDNPWVWVVEFRKLPQP